MPKDMEERADATKYSIVFGRIRENVYREEDERDEQLTPDQRKAFRALLAFEPASGTAAELDRLLDQLQRFNY